MKEEKLCAKKVRLTVDEVLEDYVGSFGFSQLVQVFLVSMARMFDSQSILVTIFADMEPASWRCISPECSRIEKSVCGMKKDSWEWSGGNTSTTVAEWGLVCDQRFLAAFPASLFFLGSLIGSAFFGHLADGFLGRKRTMLLSCLLTSATLYLISFSPNIWIYSFLRFANGFSRSSIGTCCLVLASEAVGRQWHGQVGQCGFFFFATGLLSIPLIAYPTRTSWRNLYKIISFLPIVYAIFILLPFVKESPRWLLLRGRCDDALNVLRRHAKINGKEFPRNVSLIELEKVANEGEIANKLWDTNWARKRMYMVMIMGFGIGFVYYGIQLNVENLSFNVYFAVAINAMMEITSNFIGNVLLSCTNRRLLFSWSALVCGTLCILCEFFSRNSWRLTQLMIEAFGFMAASIAFDVLHVYCVELFPTNVRNFAVSMLRQGSMLGASVCPLVVVFGRSSPSLSFCVFGVLAIVSGLMSMWLPETRNCPLYETLEQQEEEERFDCVCGDLEMEKGKITQGY